MITHLLDNAKTHPGKHKCLSRNVLSFSQAQRDVLSDKTVF